MSKAHAVAQHLPYLRRYARALTGSQASGDAYVAAALEALVKEPELLETEDLPRVALFRLFSAIWNSLAVNGIADPASLNQFLQSFCVVDAQGNPLCDGFLASSGNRRGITTLQRPRNAIEITTAMKMRFSISRDGVPTSRVQGVAMREPFEAEPHAAREAVLFDRLHHVHRAGRLEAAHGRQERRQKSLVGAEQKEGESTHGI